MELVGLVFLLIIKAFFNGFALFKAIGEKVSVSFFAEKYDCPGGAEIVSSMYNFCCSLLNQTTIF
jgi:hypothetical protein